MTAGADRWVKCISNSGSIRGVAIQATALVRTMVKMHGLDAMAGQGLGEIVMGALLLASYCKPGERVNLNVRGSGQFVQGLVDAHPDGSVRGLVVPRRPEEAFFGEKNELGPWGSGFLSVLRTKGESGGQPFIGTVPLLTGHLAKDLTFYWFQSEQIPSAVGLATKVEKDEVVSAGGFLVQAMPQASESELKMVEGHIAELSSLAGQLSADADPVLLLGQIFQDSIFSLLEEKSIRFECSCSKERAEKALALSGVAEIRDILAKDGKATIRCDFCTKEYHFDGKQLRALAKA